MNTQTRRKMIASFIFVILVCGILFDHVPDRTVISQGFSNTISSGARIDGSGIKYAIRGERFSEQTPIVCLLRSTARNTGYLSRTPLVLAGFGSLIFLAVLTALLLHLYAKGHDTGSHLRILRWLFRTDGKKRTFHIGRFDRNRGLYGSLFPCSVHIQI